jgi:hypothetical protein
LKLRMSLYVETVQIVQRQGLAVIFHVVRFSLQEPVVCGLVAGLRVSVSCHCDSRIRTKLYKGFRSDRPG